MHNVAVGAESLNKHFVLIGTPVGHSLSPVMHNAVYRVAMINWDYSAIDCPTKEDALFQIGKVRTGEYKGMNITMPYKVLAMEQAEIVDVSAKAAGGANVLVRDGFELHAYNTDGIGAVSAMERAWGQPIQGAFACVCGTGPTSMAITCALVKAGAEDITIFSRNEAKAKAAIRNLSKYLSFAEGRRLHIASYEDAWKIVPSRDLFVDATPRGMQPDDEPIVDPHLFRQGQVVLDVVYGHGLTALVKGAREQGAFALDGLEMLIEQGAKAIEIWQEAMGVSFEIDRGIMRGPSIG